MKLREYRQRVRPAFKEEEWQLTVGYPCPLPLFPTQFAMVRPPGSCLIFDDYAKRTWQVIHIASGHRVSYSSTWSKTRALAKSSALAELEYAFKKYGKKKVLEKVGK